jgi:hypothetical protein
MMDEKKTNKIRTVRDLKVYRKAFDSAMEIFELTKKFPKEETYSLTDQIRRASRSVICNAELNGEEGRYVLSSIFLATCRGVARRAKTEAVFLRPSVFRSVIHLLSEAVFLRPSVFRSVIPLHSEAVFLPPSVFHCLNDPNP